MRDLDRELLEYVKKMCEFKEWISDKFGECDPEDYTEGCLSCDSGRVQHHLSKMIKTLQDD